MLLEEIGAIQSPRGTDRHPARSSSHRLVIVPLLGAVSLQSFQYSGTGVAQVL